MDPMTEDMTASHAPPDPRRAVVFIVCLVLVAAGVTVFLSQWVPLWLTLPASVLVAMAVTRLDASRRQRNSGKDRP